MTPLRRNVIRALEISDEEFHAFLRRQLAKAHAQLQVEPREGFVPRLTVMYVRRPGDTIQVKDFELDCDFESPSKQRVLTEAGKQFYLSRRIPIAACLVSEAWGAAVPLGSGIHPRDCPDRIECIVAMAIKLAKGLPAAAIDFPFTRDNDAIVPGAIGELRTEMESPLVMHFWNGFFSKPLTRLN